MLTYGNAFSKSGGSSNQVFHERTKHISVALYGLHSVKVSAFSFKRLVESHYTTNSRPPVV